MHSKDNKFIGYCKTCEKDVCQQCIKEEKGHNIILYSEIIPSPNIFKEKFSQIRNLVKDLIKSLDKNNIKSDIRTIIIIKNKKIIKLIRNFFYLFSENIIRLNYALIYNAIENFNIQEFHKMYETELNNYYIITKNIKTGHYQNMYYNDNLSNFEISPIHKYIYIKFRSFYLSYYEIRLYNIKSFELLFSSFTKNDDNLHKNIKFKDTNNFLLIEDINGLNFFSHQNFELLFNYKIEKSCEILEINDNNLIIFQDVKIIVYDIDLNLRKINKKYTTSLTSYFYHLNISNNYLAYMETKFKINILQYSNNYKQIGTINFVKSTEISAYKINNDGIIIACFDNSSKLGEVYLYNIKSSKLSILIKKDHFYKVELEKIHNYLIIKIQKLKKYYFLDDNNQIITVYNYDGFKKISHIFFHKFNLSFIYKNTYIVLPTLEKIKICINKKLLYGRLIHIVSDNECIIEWNDSFIYKKFNENIFNKKRGINIKSKQLINLLT